MRGQAYSAVRWTTFVTVGRVALQTVQLIVLARLISPTDFGMMAMILSVTAFIQLFSDLGLSNTIISSSEIPEDVLSTLYWVNVLMGAIMSLLVWVSSPWIAQFYGTPGLVIPLALAGASFFMISLGMQIKVLAEKRLDFAPLAKIELFAATMGTVSAIIVAVLGGGVYALVMAVLVQASLNTLFYWIFARNGWLPRFRLQFKEASSHLKTGAYILFSNLANTVTLQADVLIVGRVFGGTALGFYTVPRELCMKVMFAINPIVTRVGTPLLAKAQNDRRLLRDVYLNTIRMTSSINFPIYGAIAVFRHEVVDIVFGEKWAGSADLLGAMAIWGMFRALGNPLGSLLYGTGNARVALIQTSMVAVTILPFIFVASHWSTEAVAWSLVIYYALFAIGSWKYVVFPVTGAGFYEYNSSWFIPFAVSALACVAAYIVVLPISGSFLRATVGVSSGCFVYVALSYYLNRRWILGMMSMVGLNRKRLAA